MKIEKMDPRCVLAANKKGGMTHDIWENKMIGIIIENKKEICEDHEALFLSVDGFDAHLYGVRALQKLRKAKVISHVQINLNIF